MSKRTIVDQKMCDMVRMMMAGRPKIKTVADMLGVGASTIQRIQAAGFDAQKYKQLTGERKAKERQDKEPAADNSEQVPGQMKMFFPEGGGAPVPTMDENKLIRYLAGKIELLSGWMAGVAEKMDKITDNQAQILRRMDK